MKDTASAQIRECLEDKKKVLDASFWPLYMSRLDHELELLGALVANQTVSDNGVSTLNVISFNCRGFRSPEDHITVLAEQADILCLQKHWLLKEQFDLLGHVKMDVFHSCLPNEE